MEAALFAAAVLLYHGNKPLLLDLRASREDFDHVVTLYRQNGLWGAISKSNHAVLRFREPLYKTVRELAASYFHEYFLDNGKKTLRSFSKPFNLSKFDLSWITTKDDVWEIPQELDESPHEDILPKSLIKKLRKADDIEIKAGKLLAFQPPRK